jgi:polysaccharide export outer membrane protein
MRDGAVMVPLVGVVAVVGLEPPEAEQRIAAAAVERGIYRQPFVTLRVAERAVNRVTVLGAVAEPGVVELPRGASDLVGALAAAGGLTDEAGTSVDVLRHERGPSFFAGDPNRDAAPTDADPQIRDRVHTASFEASEPADTEARSTRIDLAQAVAVPRGTYNLGDRDVIMVLPREKQVIHVTGLVHKPDQFELEPDQDVHVLDAIAMAGGTKLPIADKVFVIRRLPDMPEPAVIQVSIARAKRDGRENLRLAPGDLVSVEATVATMIVDTATNFFRVAVGLSGNVATF